MPKSSSAKGMCFSFRLVFMFTVYAIMHSVFSLWAFLCVRKPRIHAQMAHISNNLMNKWFIVMRVFFCCLFVRGKIIIVPLNFVLYYERHKRNEWQFCSHMQNIWPTKNTVWDVAKADIIIWKALNFLKKHHTEWVCIRITQLSHTCINVSENPK